MHVRLSERGCELTRVSLVMTPVARLPRQAAVAEHHLGFGGMTPPGKGVGGDWANPESEPVSSSL
jgi:hypothetical protein